MPSTSVFESVTIPRIVLGNFRAGGGANVRLFPRVYDFFMAPWDHGRLGRYRRLVASGGRGMILEIGAGTGLNFPHYDRAAAVVATDPDLAMLARARARAGAAAARIFLVVADAETVPFREAAFDDAVIGLAICTIPHPDQALVELRRVVRPGGAVRMLEHVRIDRPAVVGRLQDWLTPVWRRIAGGCCLNRRTVHAVHVAGFDEVTATPHAAGYLQTIYARVPAGRAT